MTCSAKLMCLPGKRTRLPIVLSKKLQIKNVDDPIVVQVCRRGNCAVVAHANGHGVKLINDVIVVNVASEQYDDCLRARIPSSDRYRALGAEETTGCGTHAICPSRSCKAERPVCIGSYGCCKRIVRIVETHSDWLAGKHLPGQCSRPGHEG